MNLDKISKYKTKNDDAIKHDLYKDYVMALKDDDFASLVKKLNLNEKVAMKYTLKLKRTLEELNNCKKCKSIMECKNAVNGCVYYPKVEGDTLRFDYVACKKLIKYNEEEKHRAKTFNEPLEIQKAAMKDIDVKDKNRVEIIKWVKKFYTEFLKDEHIKGVYLHGSFGSGKSYILAALLNELSNKGYNCVIVNFPEFLISLKESFNDDFKEKMETVREAQVLLIDDIGAEAVSQWSRDEILGTILQYRMDSKLPTMFTSNLNLGELEELLSNTKGSIDIVKSKRIMERIKYLTTDIELISASRRV